MTPEAEARVRAAVAELAGAIIDALAADARPAPDRLLSIDEAAASLGVGRTRLYHEVTAGRLRSMRVGRRRLVPTGALSDYIEAAQEDA